MKSPVISISSSSDDDEDDNGNFEEDEEPESEFSSQDDSSYSESDDQEYDEEEETDVESDEEECFDKQGSNDSQQELSLNECKAYLRKHGLRLSGTKEECIQRIKEHGRLKDGRGESLYPRSSFSINCTGDACKGDVVLFKQKVYKEFNKMVNRGDIVGKRTVAGRIVKESYGASKQQHTFTVEVLWNKGLKKLPPLSTLLVKGRNLYRFGTFRQAWKSETQRSKVLDEKHKRGEAARHKRKISKTEIALNNDKGRKCQKVSHTGTSRSKKQPTRTAKQKRGAAPVNKRKKDVQSQKTEMKKSTQSSVRSNTNRLIYSAHPHHHQQREASFPFRVSSFQNGPPGGYNHYNIGQPQPPQSTHGQYQYQYQYQHQPHPHGYYQLPTRTYHL